MWCAGPELSKLFQKAKKPRRGKAGSEGCGSGRDVGSKKTRVSFLTGGGKKGTRKIGTAARR